MSPAASGKVDQVYAKVFADVAALNKQFRLLWVRVGRDDLLTGPGDRAFDETLTRRGVSHTFTLTEGRHEWSVGRRHLSDVAALLFRS